jgi:uncharacterized membrane protein
MTSENGESPPSELPAEVWEKTPEQVKQVILASSRLEVIQSPLLPPELLKRYDNVIPGLPEKLVSWTEEEALHRRSMEREAFEEARALRSSGQKAGLWTSLLGLSVAGIVGVFSAIHGSAAGAAVASVLAIVSVGGPFAARILAGRWGAQDDRDRDEQD